jgi:hypothetical protein
MFYRIANYEQLNESFTIDQEIMVRTKSGWTDAVVKKVSGNIVSWSNSQGQMGSNNIKDVRPVEVRDLRNRYFPSNMKFSKFYVPFEELKSSEKSLFLGYNGKGVWVPKKLIDNIWPNKFDYPNTPRTGYQISMLVYFDEDKQKFFDDYALYIHQQMKAKKVSGYKGYKEGNRQLQIDVTKVVKHIYKMIGCDIIDPVVEYTDYETYTFNIDDIWQIECRNGSIRAMRAHVKSKTFDLSPDNVKTDTLERKMFLAWLSKTFKLETAETFKVILQELYDDLEKQKDPYADMSDDGRVWRAEKQRSELASKVKSFLEELNK